MFLRQQFLVYHVYLGQNVTDMVSLLDSSSIEFGVIYSAKSDRDDVDTCHLTRHFGGFYVDNLDVCDHGDRIIPLLIMLILQTDEFDPHHENLCGYNGWTLTEIVSITTVKVAINMINVDSNIYSSDAFFVDMDYLTPVTF